MKQYTINLTTKEIELLAICLANFSSELNYKISETSNESGTNTDYIMKLKEKVEESDNLWRKLYDEIDK